MNYFDSIKEYIKLLRVKHYVKNALVFVPLFFSLSFYAIKNVYTSIFGFIVFSLLSSIVYIINDVNDVEKDKLHTIKRKRPLAAGTISTKNAVITVLFLFMLMLLIIGFTGIYKSVLALCTLGLYLVLNILYSCGLKNIPIIDIVILASGFVFRVIFGGLIIGVEISVWLYLVITIGAFYMGFGKRRNEMLQQGKETRKVTKAYSYNFLDKNMYVCQTLCIVFYSLWSIDAVTVARFHSNAFVFTIPLVVVLLLKYSLSVEADSDGDPTTVLFHDKILIGLVLLYIASALCIVNFAGIVK
ncbi:decaprenyl-phosphate phosphoribosyltransferase [Spirochaetia bacterium]|nr:decaprenyl-phosphate phosphoribosyltransferase [Spirochaetia bacterium]